MKVVNIPLRSPSTRWISLPPTKIRTVGTAVILFSMDIDGTFSALISANSRPY